MRAVHIATIVVSFGLGGCVTDSVSPIDLEVPDKEFSIDADRWQLDEYNVPDYLETTCASAPVCVQAAKAACNGHCTGTCGANNRCQLLLDVSLYSAVDLVTERPELRSIPEQSVLTVAIDSVKYDVTTSSLNITTPALMVYVAPASVTDADDPAAFPVGMVPPLPAGSTVSAAELELTDDGRAELARLMSTYKTPFNVLVAAKLEVGAGDQLPAGRLDTVVKIRAHADL